MEVSEYMQVLQAGQHKLILLELDAGVVANVAKQAGFDAKIEDGERGLVLDLVAAGRQGPLLMFDAADPANLGWFSRCQFYVEGRSGAVLQTPISIANTRDRHGKLVNNAVRVRVSKELPADYRLPGKQTVTEQVVYALLFNVLNALTKTGIAVCGASVVQPLAGRTEAPGPKN